MTEKLSLVSLRVDQIACFYNQPRQEFDDDRTAELAESLRTKGQVEPVVVRRSPVGVDRKYQLISGERRWRAAQLIGLKELAAVIREDVGTADDQFELAVAANAAREEMSPIDCARAVKRLADMPARRGMNPHELSKSLAPIFGRSISWIEKNLRLAGLAPEVQTLVESGALNKDIAVEMSAIKQPDRQAELAKRLVSENMRTSTAANIVRDQVRVEKARLGQVSKSDGPVSSDPAERNTAASDVRLMSDLVVRIRQTAEAALDMPVERLRRAYGARPQERAMLIQRVDTATLALQRVKSALQKLGNEGGGR
jgi:ParB family chromosome partitioning protein